MVFRVRGAAEALQHERRLAASVRTMGQLRVTDNIDELIAVIPPHLREALGRRGNLDQLLEIVIDLGRPPEARFPGEFVYLDTGTGSQEEIDYVVERIGEFGLDNRAGIERTLHRISCLRNRHRRIIGLTCRVGRAIYGTIEIIRDIVETGRNILLLGRPGVGKTTILREVARVLADDFDRRVIVVDTSNEIAGDGDIPHPAIGRARRMHVETPEKQHDVMIEAVENHMPEVIIVDEIGHEADAYAARTIAERGVQLVGTAHGNSLDNLMSNPTLSDLIGGIQAVTLGDDEARRRGTQKTVLERKAPPTFDTLIEIEEFDRLAIHEDVALTVDAMLLGAEVRPEVRVRAEDGEVRVEQEAEVPEVAEAGGFGAAEQLRPSRSAAGSRPTRIYAYGVSKTKVERALRELRAPATLVSDDAQADVILVLKSHRRQKSRALAMGARAARQLTVRSNTYGQIYEALRSAFGPTGPAPREQFALEEAGAGVDKAMAQGQPVELLPQNAYIRRLQHELVTQHSGLYSESVGRAPYRRVRIIPK